MNNRIIVSLCDYSGNWSKPYKDNGFEVIKVDLKFGDDIRLFKKLNKEVYGILAAPPCTEFAGSGARWWKDKDPQLLLDGLALIDACFRIIYANNPKFWVLENPVEPEFVIKKGKRMSKMHYETFKMKKEKRTEIRSLTPMGFSKAFYEANQ